MRAFGRKQCRQVSEKCGPCGVYVCFCWGGGSGIHNTAVVVLSVGVYILYVLVVCFPHFIGRGMKVNAFIKMCWLFCLLGRGYVEG